MLKLLSISLLLVFLTANVTIAQQHDAGCASVEAKKMDFLLGQWKVKSKFRLSREPERWEETQARSRISYLFEKCLLVEQLEGTREGHPFKATAMFAHNRNTKQYEWVGADSEHGFLTLYAGSLNANDLVVESRLELQGQSILLRRVWTKNVGGFEVRSQRSSNKGQTWETTWQLSYSR